MTIKGAACQIQGRPAKRTLAPGRHRIKLSLRRKIRDNRRVRSRFSIRWVGLLGSLSACLCLGTQSGQASATGQRAIAATVHPLATDAAIAAMTRGGNAIDGAVAAALTLGVVDGHNSGIGGGCFFLIRLANGSVIAIDGRETAPNGASRDMFVREGSADPKLSQTGALASGVPGALAAYDYAVRRYGKITLKQHLLDATRL